MRRDNPPPTPGSGRASRGVESNLDEAPNRRLSALTNPTLADHTYPTKERLGRFEGGSRSVEGKLTRRKFLGAAANGDFLWRCSGSLLNESTVLTAGHCTDTKSGAASAIVWASQEGGSQYNPSTGAEDPRTGYPNECINSAQYPCAESHTLLEYGYIGNVFLHGNNKDVGMLILDDPITLDEYASIAAPASVDQRPVGAAITYSGYGVSGEKPAVISFRERLMATGFIVNTHNSNTAGFNIQLSTNPGNGRGGSCFGGSGPTDPLRQH